MQEGLASDVESTTNAECAQHTYAMGVTTSAHIGDKNAHTRLLVQTANGGSIQRKIMEHVRAPTLTRKRADSVAASNASGEETTTQTGETATIFGLAIGLTHREEANTDVADGHCTTLRLIISPNVDPATHKIGDTQSDSTEISNPYLKTGKAQDQEDNHSQRTGTEHNF